MEGMDALPVLVSWFVVAVMFFASIAAVVRRLDDSHPRYRRYGTPQTAERLRDDPDVVGFLRLAPGEPGKRGRPR